MAVLQGVDIRRLTHPELFRRPQRGDAATIHTFGGDRLAATVTDREGKNIIVTEDAFTVISGHRYDAGAVYKFTSNPNGRRWAFRQMRSGRWRKVEMNDEVGHWRRVESNDTVTFGKRELIWNAD